MKEWPKIFENAQVGDEVYCRTKGDGIIISVTVCSDYPIECKFTDYGINSTFTDYGINSTFYLYDGRIYKQSPEPTLFYRKGDERYLTERPEVEKEIDWKEWEGKEIEVRDTVGGAGWIRRRLYHYQPEFLKRFSCYSMGGDLTNPFSWRFARLIKEQKEPGIDWSNVPEGTKVKVADLKDRIDDQDIELFMGYFPKLEYPFWTFSNPDKESAHGYSFCKLAEPCKPEWYKK